MSKKIHWIHPENLFPKHPPYQPLYKKGEQNDLTEVGLQSYLQVLPSIALYGFKYAVEINKAHAVINGDFRVFTARELGIMLPVVYVRLPQGRTLIINIIIRRLRRIFKKQHLFFKRFKNSEFRFGKIPLLCPFQHVLFDDIYPKRTDIIHSTRKKKPLKAKIMTIINYYLRRELL